MKKNILREKLKESKSDFNCRWNESEDLWRSISEKVDHDIGKQTRFNLFDYKYVTSFAVLTLFIGFFCFNSSELALRTNSNSSELSEFAYVDEVDIDLYIVEYNKSLEEIGLDENNSFGINDYIDESDSNRSDGLGDFVASISML